MKCDIYAMIKDLCPFHAQSATLHEGMRLVLDKKTIRRFVLFF